jgi:hypothetical protein
MTILSHFKKGVAAVALSAMAFMVAPAVTFASLDFTDASQIPTWATEAIEELVALDVLGGNDDGSFAPARQLNRAEVAKIIVLASGVDFDTAGGAHFPDVDEDAWFYDYIETMYNYGWIDGYPDGFFRPGNGINRAELAKMVVNALELDLDITGAPHFDDVSSNDWFFDYVETAYNYDLMRGYADGTFGPAKPVNRAETAKIVYDGLLAVAMPSGPAEGTLEVALSNMTPRGTNVPYNATSVPYTTIELSASDDSDVEVSSLTFTRLGLGDNDDFKNVWMEIDGFKVGNDKSINNDDVVELRFNPPVVVPAGQTLVADLVASAKYTSTDKNVGHHNRLALVSADDVASTAMNVVGDFPIEGEEMEVADYEVSQVEFSALGSSTTINVGDNFIEIGKFRMLNTSSTNKDIELRAITFKNNGTAELENVLENVALYVSGEQVSAESIIDGDYITFRLDNGVTGGYIIEDGDSRIFSMRADIVSAEKGDTINFKVDNFEDIVAIEIGTAFGVKAVDPSGNAAEDLNATLQTYAIDSGDINVSRDPSSLGNQQYAPGSNDVIAMTARIVVDQPLLVDGVTLTSAYTGITGNSLTNANLAFNNFRLFLNDSLIDSENSMLTDGSDTDGSSKLTYDTTFEIAGASILKLVMNIQDAAPTGSTIKFNVVATDFASPEYISTGDAVPTDQLLGSAQGSVVEVTKSVLTITKTDGFSSETIVAGLDDVTFMEFVLSNNDSGDVNVTSISILGTGVDAANSYGNYTAAIFVDGTQQGSSKNLNTSDGTATFNDLSVVIASAMQKEFALVVNTSEVLSNGQTSTCSQSSYIVEDDCISTTKVAGTWSETAAQEQIETVTLTGTSGTATIQAAGLIKLATFTADLATTTANFVSDHAAAFAAEGVTVTDSGATLIFTATVAGTPFAAPVTVPQTANLEGTTAHTQANVVAVAGTCSQDATVGYVGAYAGATAQEACSDPVKGLVKVAGDWTTSGQDTIRFDITAVDVDNVENGQSVYVGSATSATLAPALEGSQFALVQSGTLTLNIGSVIYSDILVGGTDNVEVLKIRFNAADDEIQVKDLYLTNDDYSVSNVFGPGNDFKLYNEAGQLIQTRQMQDEDKLHFELANDDIISVPKDGSTFVTVKVDVRTIDQAAMTGKTLTLAKDSVAEATSGVSALTAATGSDIAQANIGGDFTGNKFVAYRSEISVKHAATQPDMALPSSTAVQAYRFTVTADAAHSVELGHITFNIGLNGFASGAVTKAQSIDTDGNIVTSSDFTTSGTLAATKVDLGGEKLAAGESRTYVLLMTAVDDAATENADGITVAVVGDATPAKGTKSGISANKIVWSDESSSSHTVSTSDWLNGFELDIDSSGKRLSK